ncbi:MAG TPA: Holliday junction branch migration protein RuvA [Candidatus Paceibacterota bacterium]
MISSLKGNIVRIDPKYIVLDVNGVGYRVFVNTDLISKIGDNKNEQITLFTYMAVRENSIDLYGFISLSELKFFELLIGISGIGPKTAMGILNVASVHALEKAINSSDTTHLTKVSGLGKKVADKIVLELKDKIENVIETEGSKQDMKNDADALEALKSLGYSQHEARGALKEVSKTISKTSEKIKEALKILGK